jgi:hypothetical protein
MKRQKRIGAHGGESNAGNDRRNEGEKVKKRLSAWRAGENVGVAEMASGGSMAAKAAAENNGISLCENGIKGINGVKSEAHESSCRKKWRKRKKKAASESENQAWQSGSSSWRRMA